MESALVEVRYARGLRREVHLGGLGVRAGVVGYEQHVVTRGAWFAFGGLIDLPIAEVNDSRKRAGVPGILRLTQIAPR